MVGYERLRIYFLSRRQTHLPNRPFNPGTTYRDILRLYECDMLLRDACFAAAGQFEILLRNAISEVLSSAHGSHPYTNIAAFRGARAHTEAQQSFRDIYRKTADARAIHYRQTYSSPPLPPIWTMKEFLTFGSSVYIFKRLSGSHRTSVANQFGVQSDQVFTRWLECLVDLRNICAHHDRLFNRHFPKQPVHLRSANVPTAPPNKLKAILECLDHLLTQRGSPINITGKVGAIIQRYPEMQPAEAGY
ncbi:MULTISPECIES: Abi family protein [unclassified Novosphingobium]|uniref:Abi family protein n=1 Tax=unclassified Novosphingobium TaxID=2644732 RepID=UPI00179C6FD1|nr:MULTISPECIES: Abi family protein [unclassified Novosphingobium]NMN07565.1 abortive infection bacteriophage resistance protein [Novosphingobium sp. SG919]NMN89832.1 abortive infection bacteriophage resistance protein [Novosphingobium sp. SG916]